MDVHNRELVQILRHSDHLSPEALANHFGVSDRTIRTYVRRTNTSLKGIATIVNHSNRGYSLLVTDEAALNAWAAGYDAGFSRSLPQTNAERVNYLLDNLLSRTDWITSAKLAEMLYVSPRTISTNLKEVEDVLARFNLELERRPHYGIRVVGSELKRRICLANTTVSLIAGGGKTTDLMLGSIAECVDEVLHAEGFEVNSIAYQNLLVHIGVAVLRLRSGNSVPFDSDRLNKVRSDREYAVAERIAHRIDEEFDIELPDEETAYIAIHLMAKQILDISGEGECEAAISDEVWDVVGRMLDVVNNTFHFDFRSDLELRMNLARHIVPLSVRLRYQMSMTNPLLSDIKRRFPLAYSMALESATVLVSEYNAAMSEDEVGYIALTLALALERRKAEPVKKNILVVCASGMGSARLLEYQYRKDFGTYLDKIIACDLAQLDRIDFSNIDYVFTTVPINRSLPIPVREVGFFLSQDERADVHALLREHRDGVTTLEGFSPELFFAHLTCDSKDTVLQYLCERAIELEDVDQSFHDMVHQREELAPTAFGNLVAMPHPIDPMSDRTFVCVGLLDKPVKWGDQQVQVVFLISIARDEDPPRDFYERLADFFGNERAIQELLDDQRFDRFLQAFERSGSEQEGEEQ